jgi:GH18 family chitinase
MKSTFLRPLIFSIVATLLLLGAAPRAAAAPWVAGYYTGWEQSQLPFASVDLTARDAVIDFAVVPTAVGTTDGGAANELSIGMASRIAAVHAAGKKILFTVGGAGAYAAFQGAMSSSHQTAFAANIVSFMTANGYDGVDIDMEPMAAADVGPYVAFARILRAQMTAAKPGSLLTAAVTWEPAAFAQLTGIFDHIDLMTYSMTGGTWYNETWHDSPVYSAPALGGGTLASVDSMVAQFAGSGIPAAKLGIGITFDPYIWTGGSGVTAPQQTWTVAPTVTETYYYTIAKQYGLVEGGSAASGGAVYNWDSSAQAAYLSVTGSPASNDAFVSYDDVSAIDAKIAYANAKGIGSVIIWDLAGGWRTDLAVGSRGKLLAAIKAAAYGTTTSTGTAAVVPVLSAVTVTSIGTSSATVTWTTNVSAESQVEYGLSAAYASTTTLNTTLATSHSVVLSGLASGTPYHYAVLSVSSSGGSAVSADAAFTTAVAASTVAVLTTPFSETFASYATNTCILDGAAFGPWTSAFSGYGCDQIENSAGLYWLEQAPAVSTAAAITHASLTLGPAFAAPLNFSVDVYTKAQLRRNTASNPWEVGWVIFDYADNTHFYSFTPQPNGWELNKEDPAYAGNQRFLASGTSPLFPIGAAYAVKIVQTSNVISVYVNGALITSYTDTLTPYTTGKIGLYNEDSDVRFSNVAVNVPTAVIGAVAVSGVGASSATVAWTTNEIADTSVEYGLTTAYGATTTPNPLLTTAHSAALTGLNGGTLYHYAVLSHNIAGVLTTSADSTFTTVSTAAPVVSAVNASSIGSSSATVAWITNEASESQVKYGLTTAYAASTTLNATLTSNHNVALSGLTAGTLYHYAVISVDALGNVGTSADATFTTLVAASTPVVVMSGPFLNNFSSSTLNTCFADGSTFGPWSSAFGGYGCTQAQAAGTAFWLNESPAVSTAAALTHAALVLGPAFAAPINFSVSLNTVAQLRQNSAPNPWEVGWVVWDYADNSHFYYFQAKPNGWELGKEDPAYAGSQRFLATGSTPVFPIGAWHIVRIVQSSNIITVYVNGQLITTFTDTQTPYTTGRIGLYDEDSNVRFANVAVDAVPGAAPSVSVVVPVTASQPAAVAAVATLSGTATVVATTSNNSAAALLQFLLDGAPLGSALSAPPFTLTFNTQSYAPGAHALSAVVWDAAGDSSASAPISILINNSAATPAISGAPAQAPQKFLSPALADGINDVATFGASAAEVSIYNVRGRMVFHATSSGAPIVWDCRDGAGRVNESGVYIAKIRTTDSGIVYQSFALVK